MCLSYCHRRKVLYKNHGDCSFVDCPFVGDEMQIYTGCNSCCHQQDHICALTGSPLPAEQRCCHWNVIPVQGEQVVTLETLKPLGIMGNETVVEMLDWLDAPYRVDGQGRVLVDLSRLGLPATYGLGTEILVDEEAMDWSEWNLIWLEAECETRSEVLS
jgi:hypothetical protein